MTKLELERAAIRIARSHVSDGDDMNVKIANFVKEAGLTAEHAKRLTERCNTQAFKIQFKKTASQEFEMADTDVILGILNTPAPIYNDPTVESMFNYGNEDISKAAEAPQQTTVRYDAQLVADHISRIVQEKYDDCFVEARDLLKEARAIINPEETLEKTAEYLTSMPNDHYQLAIKYKNRVDDLNLAKEAMLKKEAIISALVNGAVATAGGVVGGGAKLVGKLGFNKTVTGVFGGMAAHDGLKKGKYEGSLGKIASIDKTAKKMPLWQSVALAAAGMTALDHGVDILQQNMKPKFDMQRQRNAFNRMIREYPELKEENNITNHKYFSTIFRHAPDIAMDPMVAGSLVKTFHQFGGVDYNTIKDLRQTQALTNPKPMSRSDLLQNRSKTLSGFGTIMKTSSISGVGKAKLETLHAPSDIELKNIIEREKEMEIQGNTLGLATGAIGGGVIGKQIAKRMSRNKGLALTGAIGLLGALGGSSLLGTAGKAAATLGHKTTTGTSWSPNEYELAQALRHNVQSNPGEVYHHRLKRKILLGL